MWWVSGLVSLILFAGNQVCGIKKLALYNPAHERSQVRMSIPVHVKSHYTHLIILDLSKQKK